MLRDLKAIVSKEVKELVRDPRILLGMIIVPVIMFPIMGAVMHSVFIQVQESIKEVKVGVVDFDHGNWRIMRNNCVITQLFSQHQLRNTNIYAEQNLLNAPTAHKYCAVAWNIT